MQTVIERMLPNQLIKRFVMICADLKVVFRTSAEHTHHVLGQNQN